MGMFSEKLTKVDMGGGGGGGKSLTKLISTMLLQKAKGKKAK